MVSPSPHHRLDPPHHTILVFKIGNFCKILEPLSHPFFNCQLVSHSPSSFSPTLSMVSPSPQHHSFPQYQQSVLLHMNSKSFSTSSVGPPTSMLSPSPHQWSDPPPHQWSVLPNINGQSTHIYGQSFPTSMGCPSPHYCSAPPHHQSVPPHQQSVLSLIGWSFPTSTISPSSHLQLDPLINGHSFPHINGQYFLTSSFPTLLFSPPTSSVSPPTSTVSPFPYH